VRKFGIYTIVLLLFCFGCERSNDLPDISENETEKDSTEIKLVFSMKINDKAYQHTSYGEPPQIAIWIENIDSNIRHTIWVTHCAGTNQWRGKVSCPVALPVWENQHRLETKSRTDVISGATPASGLFTVATRVSVGSRWNYFIEVNAAGDYNKSFPYWSVSGSPDTEGNGQPSIIYKGFIAADGKDQDEPDLFGRSDQRRKQVIPKTDLAGIDTARDLLQNIQVISKE
jgi:hypothetical protein